MRFRKAFKRKIMGLKEQILQALGKVEDPDLGRDLVSLNMIQNLEVEGQQVRFTLVLTTPACPLKETLVNACRTAIREFVSADLEVEIEVTAQTTTQRKSNDEVLKGIKNIIAVASGKGGVGKSTVALNLAMALSKSGAQVGLLDADIHGPSIPTMLGATTKPDIKDVDGKQVMVPIQQHGLKALSMGMLVGSRQPMIWRGPMVSNALRQMFVDVTWGELDYLVVDLPPGTGDIHLTLFQSFPIAGVVVVTTPQQVSLSDTRRTMEMFRMKQINTPVLGVIENMSWFTPAAHPDEQYFLFGKGGGEQLAKEYEVPLLGQLPLIQGLAEGADKGQSPMLGGDSNMQRPFLETAARVAQAVSIANARPSEPAVVEE